MVAALVLNAFKICKSLTDRKWHGSMLLSKNHLFSPHRRPKLLLQEVEEEDRSGSMQTNHREMELRGSSSTATRNGGGFHKHADWRTQDLMKEDDSSMHYIQMAASPIYQNAANPNDEESVPSIIIHGKGPGRRAGHTATAVNQRIYIFGGSCGSDYLNDFFVLDTDPTPHTTVTEPTSLQLIERRLRHFYNDEEFSDVTFIVEGRRVHGHRMVLCLVSDCFRAMFTTGFRESSSGCTIDIPNCSYQAFMMMMEYIYSGECPKIDVTNNDETGAGSAIEMVVDLLGLADQFFLDHLKQLCEKCLQRVVNEETIEYLLHVSQKTNSKQLESCCRHFERNQGSMVDGFVEISCYQTDFYSMIFQEEPSDMKMMLSSKKCGNCKVSTLLTSILLQVVLTRRVTFK